jgi:hypothetical protein
MRLCETIEIEENLRDYCDSLYVTLLQRANRNKAQDESLAIEIILKLRARIQNCTIFFQDRLNTQL